MPQTARRRYAVGNRTLRILLAIAIVIQGFALLLYAVHRL